MPPKFYSPNEPTPAPYLERANVLDDVPPPAIDVEPDPFPEEPPTSPDSPMALHPYRDPPRRSTIRPPRSLSPVSLGALRDAEAELESMPPPSGVPAPMGWIAHLRAWLRRLLEAS